MRQIFRNLSPLVKLLIDLLILFVSFVIVFASGLLIGSTLFGVSALDMLHSGVNFSRLGVLRFVVVLQTVSLFLIPSLIIAMVYDKPSRYLLMRKVPSISDVVVIIVIFLVSQVFVNYLASVNKGISFPRAFAGLEQLMRQAEDQTLQLTRRLLSGTSMWDLVVNLIVVALIPALSEEFFFRGILQQRFIQIFRNYHIGIWFTGFVFAFVHFQFLTLLPRLFLGILLGYLFYWTKSIWASVLAHFTNNALGVIAYFIANKSNLGLDTVENPKDIPLIAAFLSLVMVIILMYWLKANAKQEGI